MFCGKLKKTVKKNQQKLVQPETKDFEVNLKKYANWLDMKKCSEKYQTSTLSRRKLDTMDLVEQNTKLELERHENEEKKK